MLQKMDDVAHWIISFKILFWDLITLHLSVLLLLGLGGGGWELQCSCSGLISWGSMVKGATKGYV